MIIGDNGERFAEEGDSGSGCWTVNGQFVGIVWASCRTTGNTYVVPFQQIMDDIQKDIAYKNLRVKPYMEDHNRTALIFATLRQRVTISRRSAIVEPDADVMLSGNSGYVDALPNE
jgi:hypothetical protein